MPFYTIYEVLRDQAKKSPEVDAILSPGRPSLSFAELYSHIEKIVAQLQDMGIEFNDRIAIVLPNGPEMATAFLATACAGASAPLNPLYTAEDYEFYFTDLSAKALIVFKGSDGPAMEVARRLGVKVLEISFSESQPAGIFSICNKTRPSLSKLESCRSEDCALVLHTSGTTSKPKLVPLTHKNITASAANIGTSLNLKQNDRCLNIMPLFHIHGLVGALFASLTTGGSVICTPGFDEVKFFDWVTDMRPTWYTGVPTMHQAILNRAKKKQQIITSHPFRLIRSCSASLPPTLMSGLEKTFSTPVVEAYGMTEACHQISVNPLPPYQRKPKSVGIPTGTEVTIMNEAGGVLHTGEIGEIVIKGPGITNGYEANPSANKEAFASGWFRTGDQGYIDSDGYIFLTGRIKEIVNRGGEKISPREVDEAFLEHPQVAQAIAFALPHPTLGQDLVVAVVPKEYAKLEERPLREFAFERLAPFKVPSKVVIVDTIPKGPTGKLQRIGLHDKLAEDLYAEYVAPRNDIEKALTDIWSKLLKIEKIGIKENFFLAGGDSITAVQLVSEIKSQFGAELPLPSVFHSPTVEQLSQVISHGSEADKNRSVTKVSVDEGEQNLYCIPGTKGNVFTDLSALAEYLESEYTVYGFQDSHRNPSKIEMLSAKYVDELISMDTKGPYHLLGICSGAVVAFEMAQQLKSMKKKVAFLGLVEPSPPKVNTIRSYIDFFSLILRRLISQGGRHSGEMLSLNREEKKNVPSNSTKVLLHSFSREEI